MNPYGTDRVRPGQEGQWIISCRRSKGWTPRVAKTLTSAEHPGTAILWDEQYFEVIAAEPAAAGTVRYVLAPWMREHAIRLTDAYDSASEARREEEHRKAVSREKGRVAANLLGLFTGHLPAIVQEHLSSNNGIIATRLTMLSLLLPLAFEIYVAMRLVGHVMDLSKPGIPMWMFLLAVYLLVENLIRLNIVMGQNRPIGSAPGLLAYSLFWSVAGKKSGAISPFAVPKGSAVPITDAPVDVALRDAYTLREPLLTLLTPDEQSVLAARFGFDYRKHSLAVIAVLMFFASAGVVTSIMSLNSRGANLSALSSLILAAAIIAEQVYRLIALQKGPVGSFLGVIVRPVAAKLFA